MWAVLLGEMQGYRDAGVAEVLGYLRVQGVISAGELGVQESWGPAGRVALGCRGCQEPQAMPQELTVPTWRRRHQPKAQLPRRTLLSAL